MPPLLHMAGLDQLLSQNSTCEENHVGLGFSPDSQFIPIACIVAMYAWAG
jgi:hypothetical protein